MGIFDFDALAMLWTTTVAKAPVPLAARRDFHEKLTQFGG